MWQSLAWPPLQVDVFVSRDLDSRMQLREAAAVAEWLRSDEPVHSMRDYPYHLSVLMGEMGGGMGGAGAGAGMGGGGGW